MNSVARNHFERFGLPVQFEIDLAVLEKNFLSKSRDLHPDFHADKSSEEQSKLVIQSAELNEAYRLLKNPWQRAKYMLSIYVSCAQLNEKSTPPGFLIQMLEANEELDSKLDARQTDTLNRSREEFAKVLKELQSKMSAKFKKLQNTAKDGQVSLAQEIQTQLNIYKYYQNLIDRCDPKRI